MTQWGLDTLFNPAKRHMDEEKQRLQSTREEVGDNSGGRRVDLESGKVVIRRQDSDDPSDDTDAPTAQDDLEAVGTATAKDATATSADPKAKDAKAKDAKAKDAKAKANDAKAKDKPEPSAAAQRAAARRGRTAR